MAGLIKQCIALYCIAFRHSIAVINCHCIVVAGPALRRSSTRVPAKRSLEPDFEVTQVVQKGHKARNARRGPTGPSKAMKPSCTSDGEQSCTSLHFTLRCDWNV